MFVCNCLTLVSCRTSEVIHYETCNNAVASSFISTITIGDVIEINDSSLFPDQYYRLTNSCLTFDPSCAQCTNDPDKIFDNDGLSIRYWYPTTFGANCPQVQVPPSLAYVLVNCLSNVVVNEPEDLEQSPDTALVTSTDLSLYVGMVVNIAEYPGNCYSVLGPYDQDTGCPCDEVTITEGYADCECCLPPPPPPACCEIPKYTQKPVKNYFRITDSDCDIKANTNFANNYYKLFMGIRYGVQNCCGDADFEKIWMKKEMADYDKIIFSSCQAILPEYCLYVTGIELCGSQTATYNDFINGRWSWTFTRDNDQNGIIYWDITNSRWVCADADTEVIIAELTTNTDYPTGTNAEWQDIVSGTCISVSGGLSTWTIPCELCPAPEPEPCDPPTDVSGEGSFD
jgi:hypothetical protein